MNRRDAKKRCYRLAATILERAEPEALYEGRSEQNYRRMVCAWHEVVEECWKKAGYASEKKK